MKKIFYYIAFLAVSFALTSCEDMFDRKPLGQQTEDDLTGGTYETQVFNMYAKLRGFHLTSGNTALAIHGMRSEDAEKGSTLSDGAATGKMPSLRKTESLAWPIRVLKMPIFWPRLLLYW